MVNCLVQLIGTCSNCVRESRTIVSSRRVNWIELWRVLWYSTESLNYRRFQWYCTLNSIQSSTNNARNGKKKRACLQMPTYTCVWYKASDQDSASHTNYGIYYTACPTQMADSVLGVCVCVIGGYFRACFCCCCYSYKLRMLLLVVFFV